MLSQSDLCVLTRTLNNNISFQLKNDVFLLVKKQELTQKCIINFKKNVMLNSSCIALPLEALYISRSERAEQLIVYLNSFFILHTHTLINGCTVMRGFFSLLSLSDLQWIALHFGGSDRCDAFQYYNINKTLCTPIFSRWSLIPHSPIPFQVCIFAGGSGFAICTAFSMSVFNHICIAASSLIKCRQTY